MENLINPQFINRYRLLNKALIKPINVTLGEGILYLYNKGQIIHTLTLLIKIDGDK